MLFFSAAPRRRWRYTLLRDAAAVAAAAAATAYTHGALCYTSPCVVGAQRLLDDIEKDVDEGEVKLKRETKRTEVATKEASTKCMYCTICLLILVIIVLVAVMANKS